MGFPCQHPSDGIVGLYSVLVLAAAAEPDVEFRIEMRNHSIGPPCPLLVACDAPAFTQHCVVGQPCFVNPSAPRICGRPVSVEQKSWTAVKQLFR